MAADLKNGYPVNKILVITTHPLSEELRITQGASGFKMIGSRLV
jgi:hypothetical protein